MEMYLNALNIKTTALHRKRKNLHSPKGLLGTPVQFLINAII